MPIFNVLTGLPLSAWQDTRINPNPRHPLGFAVVSPPTNPWTDYVFQCVVGGVTAPLDSDPVMGGRTFSSVMSMYAGGPPPSIIPTAGQSSKFKVRVYLQNVGHNVVLVRLSPNGGGMQVPFDVPPVIIM